MIYRRFTPFKTIRALVLAALVLAALPPAAGQQGTSGRGGGLTTHVDGEGLIAFSADDGQIYVMNTDGSAVTRLTDGAYGVGNRYPSFSPDGSRIAFVRDAGNDHSLCVMGADGGGLQCFADDPTGLGEPAWSPDGTRIAFLRGYDATYAGQANYTACFPDIYVVDLGTGIKVNLTRGAGGVDPAWSPDGTRIAFSSLRDDNYDIYTVDPEGNQLTRLTYGAEADAEPAWSPDGTRIAYASGLLQAPFGCGFMPTGLADSFGPAHPVVNVMNADGTGQTTLPSTLGGTDPSWSPDGSRLTLVVEAKGGAQVYVTDAAGNARTRLTFDSSQKSSPSWSQPYGPR